MHWAIYVSMLALHGWLLSVSGPIAAPFNAIWLATLLVYLSPGSAS